MALVSGRLRGECKAEPGGFALQVLHFTRTDVFFVTLGADVVLRAVVPEYGGEHTGDFVCGGHHGLGGTNARPQAAIEGAEG